ncbi:MAG: hypothetical protein OXL98_06840 [Acidimicrobiaceae bacterium]|nr:hypothetical protein [Acidimicrobiaceae bacterium]
MTATPTPAAAAAPSMAHSPDSEPAPTPRAGAAARDGAGTLAAGRTRLRDQIAANPLLSLFGAVLAGILGFMGTVVIALLAYTLATTNDRFAEVNDRFAEVNDRFARLEAKVDAGFAAQDAKIDEINLKLTALIAALNMAPEVGAALQGTLLDPAAAGTAATDPPVGAASGPRQP